MVNYNDIKLFALNFKSAEIEYIFFVVLKTKINVFNLKNDNNVSCMYAIHIYVRKLYKPLYKTPYLLFCVYFFIDMMMVLWTLHL